jgi:hypothetical protein
MREPPPEAQAIEEFRRNYKDDTEARWKFERIWAARGWLEMNHDEIRKTEFWKAIAPGRSALDGDFLWGLHQWLSTRGYVGVVPLPTVAEVVEIAKTASAERAKRRVE